DFWDDSQWSESFIVRIGNQPPDPPVIDGPKCGDPGETLTYTFVSDDFEGHDIYYYIDWGDGTFDDWFGPFNSGDAATASHSWDTEGDYVIKAKGKDELDSEGSWSESFLIRIGNQEAPDAPDIDGPRKGAVGELYGFIFSTTDPDGDKVIYEINWADGTGDQVGPISSGEEIIVNHAWETAGTYIIKARARDEFCGENSDWSEMEINIPRNRAYNFNIIDWLIERFPQLYYIIKNFIEA
ncbi:MAG: hypothetical protein JSU91_03100, partial [Thermoplasmatales archaeon]